MTINPILYQYQAAKFPDIYNDYMKIRSSFEGNDGDTTEEGIPIWGRISSLPEKFHKEDYLPAMGAVSLAIMNGPEELNDVMSAYKQIKEGFPKPVSYHSGYDNNKAQHPFSFFRGTILHKYMNPLSPDCPNPKLAGWLIKEDKTLWDTKIGEWVKNVFKIKTKEVKTDIQNIDFSENNKNYVSAKIFKTNNPFADITARALIRTPKLGAITLGTIEAAHVAHEVSDGKNFFEEAGKSALTLGTGLAATGVLGAIGAKHLGPTGSLLGISAGAIAGAIAGAAVNKSLD